MKKNIKDENIVQAFLSLKNKGFYIFNQRLPDKTCDLMIKKINKYKPKVDKDTSFHQSGSYMIYNLFNKDELFLNLIFEKNFLLLCDKYFRYGAHKSDKNLYQFELMHSRIIKNKSKDQDLHLDSRICGADPPTSIHFFIYLHDVIKSSGATQLVPYSHKKKRYPEKKDKKKAIKILGKKGTIIALNSSLWHGSSKKSSIGERAIITLAYSRWFIRQQFAVPYSINKKFDKKLTKSQKMILGYENYAPVNELQRVRARGNLPIYKK